MKPIPGRTISYNLLSCDNLASLTNYIPNFIAIDSSDEIPGIDGRYLPPVIQKGTRLKTMEGEFVYIKNIEVSISASLEKNILEYATKYQKLKFASKFYM